MSLLGNMHFAFNVWDFESARAVIDAGAELSQDVIIQTSASIFKRLPVCVFSDFVNDYSKYKGVNAWLNIDHCKEKEILFMAIDSGWDIVMADGSSFSLEDNIRFTNDITSYAHKKGVLVEAEVGQVKGIEDDMDVRQAKIASKKSIELFLSSTNVDFIAVAFGNAHGEYNAEPDLHYDLVEYTTTITDKPFVVHGGSGLSDEVLLKLINIKGVKKINISTDLKMAYKRGIELGCTNWIQPINASHVIHDEIEKVAVAKMTLISGGFGR